MSVAIDARRSEINAYVTSAAHRTPEEAMRTNMDLSSFRAASILYGIGGEKVPDSEGITDTSDIIKVGLTGPGRSAAARVGDYVRSKCIAPGVVHFLFDSESDGVLIEFNGKAFETVTHFMVGVILRSRACRNCPSP